MFSSESERKIEIEFDLSVGWLFFVLFGNEGEKRKKNEFVNIELFQMLIIALAKCKNTNTKNTCFKSYYI